MHQNWLDFRVKESPDKVFIRYNNQEFSYTEFNNILYDRILGLISVGLKARQKVVIYLSDPIDFIEAYLACLNIDAISIVFNHEWKKIEIKKAMDLISPDYVICNWNKKELFTEYQAPIISFEELSKSHGSCYDRNEIQKIDFNSTQSILFTSGTKGIPKPVCLTYENFYQSSIKWNDALDFKDDDQYHLYLPLYHIGGLAIIMRALHLGFSVNINVEKKLETKYQSSIISVVPTLLISLIKEPSSLQFLKKLRCIILSGAHIPKELLDNCEKHGLKIFVSYGMTETCSSICGFWPFLNKDHRLSVGKPFKGVSVSTKNNAITIESDTVMSSYYGKEQTDDILITKDLGVIKDDYVYLEGRSDGVIISGGENIDQKEVVAAISMIEKFDKVIPFSNQDPYWGDVSGVYIFTDKEINPDDIRLKLKELLSKSKIPKEIIIKKSTGN